MRLKILIEGFTCMIFRFVPIGRVFDILFMTYISSNIKVLLDLNFKIMSYGVVTWEPRMRNVLDT